MYDESKDTIIKLRLPQLNHPIRHLALPQNIHTSRSASMKIQPGMFRPAQCV